MVIAVAVGLALTLGGVTSAVADPLSDREKQNDDNIAGTQAAISSIEVQLAEDQAALDAAQDDAAIAAEDYNRATEQLEQAKASEATAKESQETAKESQEAARRNVAKLVLAIYQSNGGLSDARLLLTDGAIEDVVTKSAAYGALGAKLESAYQEYTAASDVADVMNRRAADAVAKSTDAAAAAEQSKAAADQAESAAAQAVTDTESRKDTYATQLAGYRQTSVDIERQRIAQAEADRAARANAAAQQAAQQRPAPAPGGSGSGATTPPSSGGGSTTPPSSGGGTTPPSTGGGSSSGNATKGEAAVAWAKAQIGKPYLWAAIGPNAFDCSGLTQQAWRQGGGISIPRTSRDQYTKAQKVAYSEMRVGDLIFWSKNASAPSQIYHVAIYAGNGQMVEAPKPGDVVKLTSVRWANTMPYAGRV